MPQLPDLSRPRLTLRRLRPSVARFASAALWRALNPAARERFLERGRPTAASRRYYEAPDGWRAPLVRLDPAPGGAGEPVVLAHGLGVGPDAFRYGAESLAGALREAGFTVYLLCHRADPEATPPPHTTRARVGVDDIVDLDLPAALAAAAADSGYDRVHLVGHGLGGLLALAVGARRDEHLATVTVLGAPLTLPEVRSEARVAQTALMLAPARWRLPLATAARLSVAMLGDEGSDTPAPRLRGALAYTLADPPLGLLRSLSRWARVGEPSRYDGRLLLADHLADARVPLLVVTGTEDTLCPPDAGERALRTWGANAAAVRAKGLGHLDLLLGTSAPERVFAPVTGWLETHRRACWEARSVVG